MTKDEIQSVRQLLKEEIGELKTSMDEQFTKVNEKLDELKFEMDTVYGWVDSVALEVKDLKKAQGQ